MRYLKLFLLPLLLVSLAPNVSAQTSVGKYIESWQTVRHTFRDGRLSCQAIQCDGGDCGRNRFFLLVATSDQPYIVPQFNNGVKVPPGTQVQVQIGGKNFTLQNRGDKPEKFLSPADRRGLDGILNALAKLENTSGARKFSVIDAGGRKRTFSARGSTGVFKEFQNACGVPIPK
jgi:hypothetical protein